MQRQVTGGIKFPVLGNHDIIRLVFIVSIHGDIAVLRLRCPVYPNRAVRYM